MSIIRLFVPKVIDLPSLSDFLQRVPQGGSKQIESEIFGEAIKTNELTTI